MSEKTMVDSDAERQPDPGAAGEGRPRGRGECSHEDLAFEADVDHAGALRPKARETGEDERDGEPHPRGEDDDEGVERFHGRGPQIGGCVVRRASNVATGRRNMCSSAPANSTTRPWMTTIMSRLIFGFSKASSAPP